MNPLRIKARNYRTFRDVELTLPAGCVAILGPNGAGKSSLANVVDLALFGPDGRSWAPYLTLGVESTELELELVFEHAGTTYRVRRGYSSRGSGKTTLDLEVALHHKTEPVITFDPLTRESQKATQTLIEEIVGMTRQTFRASSMLVQGDGEAFTDAEPRERKTILSRILGLDRYERLLEAARVDRRETEKALDRIAGELEAADRELLEGDTGLDRIALLEAAIADGRTATREAEEQREWAQAELESAAQTLAEAERIKREKAEAIAYLAETVGRLHPLEQRLQAADEAARELETLQDEVDSLSTPAQTAELERRAAILTGRIDEHRRRVMTAEETERVRELRIRERDAMLAQARAARERAGEIANRATAIGQGKIDVCPTCEQELGVASREATVGSLRAQAEILDEQATASEEQAAGVDVPDVPEVPALEAEVSIELAELDKRLQQARDQELQRARLEGRAQALRDKVAARPTDEKLEELRAAAAEARAESERIRPVDEEELQVVRANALAVRARVNDLDGRLRALHDSRARAEADLDRLLDLRSRTEGARTRAEGLRGVVDELALLERAYGRDGIPALIIRRGAIPAIEAEANRILSRMPTTAGETFRVELRTEKAKADGGISDALDVITMTDAGERAYETFSGGERTRISLALRFGLAGLLASRRAADCQILVIDEPDGLDTVGKAALIELMLDLEQRDRRRLYLISHDQELIDRIPASLEVVRGPDGYSTVEAA